MIWTFPGLLSQNKDGQKPYVGSATVIVFNMKSCEDPSKVNFFADATIAWKNLFGDGENPEARTRPPWSGQIRCSYQRQVLVTS